MNELKGEKLQIKKVEMGAGKMARLLKARLSTTKMEKETNWVEGWRTEK